MKFVVGYDKALATQCFRRNLTQLIRPGQNPMTGIGPLEIDYVSERLAETSVFNLSARLGNPWIFESDINELVNISAWEASRRQLQKCEDVANNILIFEGIISRAGAMQGLNQEQRKILLKWIRAAKVLYHNASQGTFHSSKEKTVLRGMSGNTEDWIRWLSYLPGNDFMDLLSKTPSQYIHLS